MAILDRLSKAQGGQAFANLARAFHLPPAKIEPAVDGIIAALVAQITAKTPSRRFLSHFVELLDERDFRLVLENPTMLGTTSTQVLGNKALNAIAGREATRKIARQTATQADVSEMIAEYLLPVVAAMLVGAIADASTYSLEALLPRDGTEADAAGDRLEAAAMVAPLPQVASGGVGFSGSTGGGVGLASPRAASERLAALAKGIRESASLPDGRDAASAARRALTPYLALPRGPLDWIARLRALGGSAFRGRGRRPQ
jgi:hypothetical protein